jgi:hypothetical protein
MTYNTAAFNPPDQRRQVDRWAAALMATTLMPELAETIAEAAALAAESIPTDTKEGRRRQRLAATLHQAAASLASRAPRVRSTPTALTPAAELRALIVTTGDAAVVRRARRPPRHRPVH